jgi:protocatechuate 4,5-dioxygenase alpha chain
MSVNGLESALYDLGSGAARKRFADDRGGFLQRYRLAPDEAALVVEEDVAGLLQRGANPMLVMGFYLGLHGPQALPDYIGRAPTLASLLDR